MRLFLFCTVHLFSGETLQMPIEPTKGNKRQELGYILLVTTSRIEGSCCPVQLVELNSPVK